MRHLLQSSEHLAAATATAAASGGRGVHTDTFLILAAVLCFLLCVVGLALVARCSRLCNPSSFAVEAEEAMPPAPCKGLKRKALLSLPTVSFAEAAAAAEEEEERPECAICLAEFARGDEVRVLPPCGHGFHAACVDVWLVSTSTCPSCRRAIVVLAAPSPAVAAAAATDPPPPCCAADAAQASSQPPQPTGASDRGGCRTSVP
uniref:RING-type domain-containing protein n=1 Tax=Oryza meridionalis TaxID=40149 RepID=A0A0E0EUQ0_9ORYZ